MDLALNNRQWLICHETKPNLKDAETFTVHTHAQVGHTHTQSYIAYMNNQRRFLIVSFSPKRSKLTGTNCY